MHVFVTCKYEKDRTKLQSQNIFKESTGGGGGRVGGVRMDVNEELKFFILGGGGSVVGSG